MGRFLVSNLREQRCCRRVVCWRPAHRSNRLWQSVSAQRDGHTPPPKATCLPSHVAGSQRVNAKQDKVAFHLLRR